MSGTAEKSWSSPDDPEFQKKFKAFVLQRVMERQEAQPNPKTDPVGVPPSEEPISLPPVNVPPRPPQAKSESTTATTDKKVDEGNLEARLGKKIDDAFALLHERLDKEFQLLHHIMVAT
ncbi:hypothetical protein HYE67_006623 [Fusarium culmorum]|uniref:Uncharacterized protein n=1 Tax=Fusarium culmorum TaxID=5516 RepID=A0A7S8HWU9_FUSCU|nr:hypothetical protein HYE67_006623 [Fusarium culmorum]